MTDWNEALSGLGEARAQVDAASLAAWVDDVARTLIQCRNRDDFTPLAHVFSPELIHRLQVYDAAEKASGHEKHLEVEQSAVEPIGALVHDENVQVRVRVRLNLRAGDEEQVQREVWTLSTPLTGRVLAAAGARCEACGAPRPAASGACLWCGTLLTVAAGAQPWQVIGRQSS